MKSLSRRCTVALLSLALGAPVAASAKTAAGWRAHRAGNCVPTVLHVALASDQPTTQTISGTFCTPSQPNRTNAIDILVHGAAHDRSYWDSGFNRHQYSYVERTLEAGRAVFNYDRLGVGKSSALPSSSVTIDADAYVLHQILAHFHPRFRTIDVIGHSYGSRIAQVESGKYNDATRLVLTDNLHAFGSALAKGLIVMQSVAKDPQFAGQHLDPAWMTTTPGSSRAALYYLPGADSNEVAYDDAHRSIFSALQFQQGAEIGRVPAGSNVTNSITLPVLLVLGEEDGLYCGLALDCTSTTAVTANEQPFYTSAASLTVITIPNTGHDLALHRSAGASFDAINHWLEE